MTSQKLLGFFSKEFFKCVGQSLVLIQYATELPVT